MTLTPDTMPLFSRAENIAFVLRHMRDAAHEISTNIDKFGNVVQPGQQNFALLLEQYATVLDILQCHGTRGYYLKDRCRCDWCRSANKQYMQRNAGNERIKFVASVLAEEEGEEL